MPGSPSGGASSLGCPQLVVAIEVLVLAATVTTSAGYIWSVHEGDCAMTSDGCIQSPNYPLHYGDNSHCRIQVQDGNYIPIDVMHFSTEFQRDFLTVNGLQFNGRTSPHGFIPNGWIDWAADGEGTDTGWRICPGQDCIETLEGDGSGYRGCQTNTRSGARCEWWVSNPQYITLRDNNPLSDLRDNLCRNPDGKETIWCFTSSVDWEYCDPSNSMWRVLSGPCEVESNTDCAQSQGYPLPDWDVLRRGQICILNVNPSMLSPLSVQGWNIGAATLQMNGNWYLHDHPPHHGIVPVGSLFWYSQFTLRGWKLCPITTTTTTTASTATFTTSSLTSVTATATTSTATTSTETTSSSTTSTASTSTETTATTTTSTATATTSTATTSTVSTVTTTSGTTTTNTMTSTTSSATGTATTRTESSTTVTSTTSMTTSSLSTSSSTKSTTTTTPEPVLLGGQLELQMDDPAAAKTAILTDPSVKFVVQAAIATGLPDVRPEDVRILDESLLLQRRRLGSAHRALAETLSVSFEADVPATAGIDHESLSVEEMRAAISPEVAALGWILLAVVLYDPLSTTTSTTTTATSITITTTHVPIDCMWGGWAEWTLCTLPCSGGSRTRQRPIETWEQHGGLPCSGAPEETEACNTFSCQDCLAGYHLRLSQTEQECLACPAGSYNPNSGATDSAACLACATGRVSEAGFAECTACSPGSAAMPRTSVETPAASGDLLGQAVKVEDHVVFYGTSAVEFQIHCSSDGSTSLLAEVLTQENAATGGGLQYDIHVDGEMQTTWGIVRGAQWHWSDASLAFEVSSGNHTLRFGGAEPDNMGVRTLSLGGHCGFVSIGAWICGDCKPGSYAPLEASTACSLCEVGTYAADEGLSECVLCDNGTFSGVVGADDPSTCSGCPPGTIGTTPGAVSIAACSLCPQGSFAEGPGNTACELCDVGTVASSAGSPLCSPCPSGEYAPREGMGTCLQCKRGSFNNQTGRGFCDACDAGTFNPDTASVNIGSCRACPFGQFGPETGRSACVDCGLGTFLEGVGATSSLQCQNCSAGTHGAQPGTSQCVSCAPGQSSTAGSSACVPCSPGHFALEAGSSSCTPCGPGTYVGTEEARQCTECQPGTYSTSVRATNASTCIPCPGGRFSVELGAPSSALCQRCSPGTASQPGSDTCETCNSGSYSAWEASECTACEAGRFAAEPGASQCEPCAPGEYRDLDSPGHSCTLCDVGRYSLATGAEDASSCLPCSPGFFNDQRGATACTACPGGSYSGPGAPTCLSCEPGNYSEGAASSCTACAAGRYAAAPGTSECEDCPPGTYRHSDAPGASCVPCRAGTYSARVAATDIGTCQLCAKGMHGPRPGLLSCIECSAGFFADEMGLSTCSACDDTSDSPAAAVSCCPHNDISSWPVFPAGSLYTAPGKSETRIHYLDKCSSDSVNSLPGYVVAGSTEMPTGTAANLATLLGFTPHEHRCLECGSPDCQVKLLSDRDLFIAGDSIQAEASILVNAGGKLERHWCNDRATLILAGFGCAPETLSSFLTVLSAFVVLTLLLGMLLEIISRARLVNLVECSLDIVIQEGRALTDFPTDEMLYSSVFSALQLRAGELPRDHFHTWLFRDGGHVLHVEFAVKTRGREHHALRQRLLKSVWVPVRGPEGWVHAKIEQQPPSVVKGHSQVPGFELFVLLEQAALVLLGGVESEQEAGMKRLHMAVAREVLERLTSRTAMVFLLLQYFSNILAAAALPALGFHLMSSCEEGYPLPVHIAWLAYILVSSVLSLLLLRCCLGGPRARSFCWRCATRLLLRVVFASIMLTDTYQDATFAVIAKKCGFDLWFVSAWLIILGVGIMQVFAQFLVLTSCVLRYHRATTPEQRQRLLVEGAFLALRGSDNLALTYAVRPAVEEQLGGASSWAMKMSEARIAFFRFIFEDVEQSALQVVFLIFYEDANIADKVWVSFSIATSLLLSFTLVVQCVPEVRDWLWYRIFARFPGGRVFPQLRVLWICCALALYRVLSSFPWVSSCSPTGDPCKESYLFWGCSGGSLTMFGLPARMEVVHEVARTSAYCLFGLVTSVVLAGLVWWMRYWRQRRASQRSGAEEYSAEGRFAACSESLRPKVDADDDIWLVPARQLHQLAATEGGVIGRRVPKLVEAIDESIFRLSRSMPAKGMVRSAGSTLESQFQELVQATSGCPVASMAESVQQLSEEAEHVQRLACVRQNVRRLLMSRSFLRASLWEKADKIDQATDGAAPLQLVHWTTLEALGELPMCGAAGRGATSVPDLLATVAGNLGVSCAKAERHTVCFFLSHRWLRTKGPRSAHHPDSHNNTKAQRLSTFARWFMNLAGRTGLRCEVAFWIDWSCCDQVNPRLTGLGMAALPLYVAACTKVLSWRTNDFERRCWTMVERLLSYSFCVGGLTPYVIDETFHMDEEEEHLRALPELPEVAPEDAPSTRPTPEVHVCLDPELLSVSGPRLEPSRQPSPGGDCAPMEAEEESQRPSSPSKGRFFSAKLVSYRSKISLSNMSNLLSNRPSRPGLVLQRRARKLPNPLDLETCQLTRAADRCEMAFLVDTALAVPAFEVFADRQPVEWGLTEVIEQSLAVRDRLPSSWTGGDSPPETWLALSDAPAASSWRLVVRSANGLHSSPVRDEEEGTMVWVEQGLASAMPVPSPAEIERLFASVDEALMADSSSAEEQTRALISALRANLQAALKAGDQASLEAAVVCARDVETPEKEEAIERICTMRLVSALYSGDEAAMRGALRLVQRYGVEHLPEVAEVRAEQLRLHRVQLANRLSQLLESCERDGRAADLASIMAVYRTAVVQSLEEIQQHALAVASLQVGRLKEEDDLERLLDLQYLAKELDWDELVKVVEPVIEGITMVRAMEVATPKNDFSALRAVEKRAQELEFHEIVEAARVRIREVAGRVGERLGLPADWDVVLELAGTRGKEKVRLLKKSEAEGALLEKVQELVDFTYFGWGGFGKLTRTRDRGKEPVAERLKVMSVVRVQNAEAYVNYRAARARIAARVKREPSTPVGDHWDVKTTRVSFAGIGGMEEHPVDKEINEHYLWHGTTPKSAEGITDREFDMRRVGKRVGTLFGPGVYLAESCMKSDEYVRADTRGWFPVILCRAVLGRINYCDSRDPHLLGPRLEASCKQGGQFDSVLGDREKVVKTFREFIVFDTHQVYPEFIVWYTREMPSDETDE